ncbi:MAG: hypothetical protein HYW05_01560 [Candidatus Diapherotrites archaeon]|nr:hypothetical protein [Candidatus Diapherotrites archaeon]
MRGRKPIAQIVVHIGPKRRIQYKASNAVKIAELANKHGLILVSPDIVSTHIKSKILGTVPGRGGRFFVSEAAVRDYFTWLSTRWQGANLIKTAITENRLFNLARKSGIWLYNPIRQMIRKDISNGQIKSVGRIKIGHNVYNLFNAKAASDYIGWLKKEIPRRESASARLGWASRELEKAIKKIKRSPDNAGLAPKALSAANNTLAGLDKKIDPSAWGELNNKVSELRKLAHKSEKKIAISNARVERERKRGEKERLRRERKAEKKAMAQMRRRAHEIKMLEKPEETKRMQRFEKKIAAELKKEGLWTLRDLAEKTAGKRSPSHVFHDFEMGAIPGAYHSNRYKARSGMPLVVVPEKNALNYIKWVIKRKQKWVVREKKQRKPGRKEKWREPADEIHESQEIRELRVLHRSAIEKLQNINKKLPIEMLENTNEENMPDNWKIAHAKVAELARKIREAGY